MIIGPSPLQVLFQTNFNAMLHASGKFVPQILAKLAPNLEEEDAKFLEKFQVRKHPL